MITEVELPVEERLLQLLQHLGIERTHVADRLQAFEFRRSRVGLVITVRLSQQPIKPGWGVKARNFDFRTMALY